MFSHHSHNPCLLTRPCSYRTRSHHNGGMVADMVQHMVAIASQAGAWAVVAAVADQPAAALEVVPVAS